MAGPCYFSSAAAGFLDPAAAMPGPAGYPAAVPSPSLFCRPRCRAVLHHVDSRLSSHIRASVFLPSRLGISTLPPPPHPLAALMARQGRGHWSLAEVGSERVFNDFNGEGHRTGTYVEGRRGISCERTTEIAGHCGRGSICACLAVG